MTFAQLDLWARQRSDEPLLQVCAYEARQVGYPDIQIDRRLRLGRLERRIYYGSLPGRMRIWARCLWGRDCAYDAKRRVFLVMRPVRGKD